MNFPSKTSFLIFFFLFTSLHLASSQSIDSIFVNMPARLNPLLNKPTKLKMLNNYKKQIPDSVQNSLGGKSVIIKYDSIYNFIKIQNAANSRMEIFTFKTTQGNFAIGVISTIGDTLQNSEIRFFNQDWSRAKVVFRKPDIKDWIKRENINENGTTPAWATEQTVVGFITLEYDVASEHLIARPNFLKYISKDVKELVEPHFSNDSLQFVLQGNEWVKY